MSRRPLRAVGLILAVTWGAGVWWLLLSPRVAREPLFPGAAYLFNMGHAALFGVQALLLGMAVGAGRVGRGAAWLAASVAALAYGGVLEWLQGEVPGRSSSWIDVVTNGIGALGAPWVLADREGWLRRAAWVVVAAAVSAAIATSGDGAAAVD